MSYSNDHVPALIKAPTTQVLIAFLFPAWLSFGVLVLGYFFVEGAIPEHKLNQVDATILQIITRHSHPAREQTRHKRSCLGVRPLRSFLLALSDQQLFTGLAILLIGFATARDVSEHHFRILSALGWLSFLIFSCTTTVLRAHFIRNKAARLWRTIWTVVMAGFLAVTIATENVSSYDSRHKYQGRPVYCVWNNLRAEFLTNFGALLFVFWHSLLLAWTLLRILIDLWPREVGAFFSWSRYIYRLPARKFRDLSCRLCNTRASTTSTTYRIVLTVVAFQLKLAAYIWTLTLEFVDSQAFDLLRAWYLLLRGNVNVFTERFIVAGVLSGSEDQWGFGQVLPMMMLALPFLKLLELYYGRYQKTRLLSIFSVQI